VELCDRVDDPDLVSRALYMQWGYGTWTARHRVAERAATRMLAMGEARGERVARLMGHGLLGRVQCYLGDLQEGRRSIERSLVLADPEQDGALALKYGQDPVMAGLAGLSWCLWLLGYSARARQAREQAVERAELVKHPQTLSYALAVSVGILGLLELDAEDLEPHLTRLERLVDEQGFKHWNGYVLTARAVVLSARGDQQAAREAAREGRAATESAGCGILAPLFASVSVRVLLAAGATLEAQREAQDALATALRTEERFAVAELERLQGEIALARGQASTAAECFDSALATARAQAARMLELRAATARAQLLASQGEQARALRLLEPICVSFAQEPHTRDIAQARALVQQLS
jgi:predicted ATPase